jgi:hypothetical protein
VSSSIYAIWLERNNIQHGNNPLLEEKIIQRITWKIKGRLASNRKFLRSRENVELCKNWGMPVGILR